jgi:hypothetical protein
VTARRLFLGLAAASLLVLPSTATAAKKPAKKVDNKAPTVTKVTPKSAKVGDVLTITGRNFVRGKRKNQVFFFTAKGGGTWATADDASATRLKVRVPDKLANLLPANGDQARIRLRVKGKRLGVSSAAKVSPLIAIDPNSVGGDPNGSNPGVIACTPNYNDPSSDVDKDLLPDARERDMLTDPCNRDSDGDGASDGYEYYSAIDLNSAARPYPGKRPYPNPLFKDPDTDYDGDGLTMLEEYSLWNKYGGNAVPLNYSDGKQASVPTAAPSQSGPLYYMDLDKNGILTDDERDADGDGLGNWDESPHGRMQPEWWIAQYSKDPTLETPYPVTFAGTSMLDPDTDGDGVPDGADDQDFDGLSNSFEIERPPNWGTIFVAIGHNWDSSTSTTTSASARFYARVQPFNPCKPVWSERCHLHPPFDYYKDGELWMGVTGAPAPGARPGDV